MDIKSAVAGLSGEVVHLRRDFHAHPELGFQEYRTAQVIEEYLAKLGIASKRVAETGVVAVIEGNGPGPVLMLRADIDALPVTEENEVSYRSQNSGIMHACGHDAHTAMLLVAAKILAGMRHEFAGSIKLVFQPNEEIAGALRMIEEGVLEDPHVDAVMGLHVWTPIASGIVGISAGAVMAGMEVFSITIQGKGGHTSSPETAADPIIAAADLVQTAQRIQTREISLMKPTVLVFGSIAGGTQANIIPDAVTLKGSIRTLYADSGEEQPMERLVRIAEQVCATHGCTCHIDWYRENIPLINDSALAQLAAEVARDVVRDTNRVVPYACMASEDFSEFAARVPGVFVFLGTGNEEKESNYPHHNPRFNIDEETLPLGVELLVRFARSFFVHKTHSRGYEVMGLVR